VFSTVIGILSDTILSNVQGTALMATWLRMLGAEVGDGVYFDTIPPVETDRLVIKDGATLLNAPQSLVPHALDRGMLQFAKITIEKNASISLNTCLNLHSHVGEGGTVGASSVLMKAERVPAHAYAEGNPSIVSGEEAPSSFVPQEVADGCCGSYCGSCSKFASCLCCAMCCKGSDDDDSVMVPLFNPSQPVYQAIPVKDPGMVDSSDSRFLDSTKNMTLL